MEEPRALPILPHIASEFYAWLWWASENQGAVFELAEPAGQIEVWIDERLAFRNPDDTRVLAVMTGENPSATLEARAALAGGKVLQDLRIGVRRDDREFFVTLKGPAMHLQGLKLPAVVEQGGEEVIFERMHLYEELTLIVSALFRAWNQIRVSPAWGAEVLPALHEWIVAES